MAYRSNSFSVSPWQRGQSFPMGSYSQGYNSYGGYAWNDNYSMNQMGRMAYDTPFRYGNERPGRNQMSPRRKPMHGKRLPQRSPASGPPSKRPNFGDKSKRRNDSRKRFSRTRKNFRKQAKEDTASDFEEYEILKTAEDDAEAEKDKDATAQNEETMEVNGIGEKKENEGEEKKEVKKEAAEKKEVKKFTACHVCKVASTHAELLEQHMATEDHKTKIEAALSQYREKKTAEGADKEKNQKKSKSDNWCTVCEIAFTGHFLSHRSTSEHRRIRDKKYPKCRPCSAGFSSAEEYKDHIKSDAHKQKSAEFYHFKKLPIGFDNDEAALEPIKVEEEEPKEDEAKVKEEPKEEAMETDAAEDKKAEDGDKTADKDTEEKDKKEGETKKAEEKKPKKPNPIGLSFVVEVDGFYCKLCRKFFKDGSVAKKKHCYSVMHYEAYKQAMEVALKDEEERQKVAEVHAKAEAEAAEAARLASEVAAIQREARIAAKKAAAEKKAAQKAEQPKEEKDEGIEMSPADEQEKPAEVKQEQKEESSLPDKKEQTEEMCT